MTEFRVLVPNSQPNDTPRHYGEAADDGDTSDENVTETPPPLAGGSKGRTEEAGSEAATPSGTSPRSTKTEKRVRPPKKCESCGNMYSAGYIAIHRALCLAAQKNGREYRDVRWKERNELKNLK